MSRTTSEADTGAAAPAGWLATLQHHVIQSPLLTGAGLCCGALGIWTGYVKSGAFADTVTILCGVSAGVLICAAYFVAVLRQLAARLASTEQLRTELPPSVFRLSTLNSVLDAHRQTLSTLQLAFAELREQSELLADHNEILTKNIMASIVIRDSAGAVAYCSPYTEVLTGYSLAEIHGAGDDFFSQIIHEDDLEQYRRALRVTGFGEPYQFRYRIFHKTGMEMWAETRMVPIIADEGNVASSLAITLDVTASVRQQKQLEETNRDLKDFSYMISHDLKSPIYTIKGMVTMIDEDFSAQLHPDINEALQHIQRAVSRLEQLVSSVLEYSRITTQDSTKEPINPEVILDEVKNDFSMQLEEAGATIVVDTPFDLVLGDRLKLYQIFSNLIGNAIKYRDRMRPLVITVRQETQKSDRYSAITIRDNGLGIPADRLEAVFRPFHRAHGKDIEGSGIGLACVKKLLEKLGGAIDVESNEGEGSTFTVTFRNA